MDEKIRNEQVVGSSPIASSSDFNASGVPRGLFVCLELANRQPIKYFQRIITRGIGTIAGVQFSII